MTQAIKPKRQVAVQLRKKGLKADPEDRRDPSMMDERYIPKRKTVLCDIWDGDKWERVGQERTSPWLRNGWVQRRSDRYDRQ